MLLLQPVRFFRCLGLGGGLGAFGLLGRLGRCGLICLLGFICRRSVSRRRMHMELVASVCLMGFGLRHVSFGQGRHCLVAQLGKLNSCLLTGGCLQTRLLALGEHGVTRGLGICHLTSRLLG